MIERKISVIVFSIIFSAILVGVILGIFLNSVKNEGATPEIVKTLVGFCSATDDTNFSDTRCISGLAVIVILTFIIGILGIIELKPQVGNLSTGLLIYIFGIVLGFIIGAVI